MKKYHGHSALSSALTDMEKPSKDFCRRCQAPCCAEEAAPAWHVWLPTAEHSYSVASGLGVVSPQLPGQYSPRPNPLLSSDAPTTEVGSANVSLSHLTLQYLPGQTCPLPSRK